MYYNLYKGMHNTWSDRFGSITRQLTGHNWLPTAVGGVMILWVGLLFAAINQTGPANPGAPSDLSANKSTPAMAVTTVSSPSGAGNSGDSANLSSQQSVPAASETKAMSSASVPVPETTITPSPVIGGRGGDSSPQAQPTPTAPTAPALPAVDVGLTVDTPLTPAPITVDAGVSGSGVQLDVNAGGLL